jgi:hypothetical protein
MPPGGAIGREKGVAVGSELTVIDKFEGDNTASLTVFTEAGIDNLRELILDMKRNGQWPPEKYSP